MPLWFDMLRTPMAAPETVSLKVMRRTWLLLCLSLAACVTLLEPLEARMGRGAPAAAAVLLLVTAAITILYWRAKQRADNAHLDKLGRAE